MANTATKQTAVASFLKGGGEMGKLIRSKDWSRSSIGEPHEWPQSLRTSLSILLNSKFPMFLFWGEELICFYNDAYRPSLGSDGKHPHILGMPGEQAWPEIWEIIKPLIDQVLSGGEATWFENQLIPIYRNGKIEDVYWTFSYSPVNDESGNVSAVFVTCNETTTQVINLKKLEESEKNFRNLVYHAPVPAALFKGRDLIIELANEEVLKVWGKDESVIGKRLIDAIPELRDQPFIGLIQDVYSTGIPYEGREVPARVEKNGQTETVYFNLIYKALYDGNGQISNILAMGYDVSWQMASQKKIMEAEERLRIAVDASGLGTFESNFQTGEIRYSKRYLEIMGFNSNSLPSHQEILEKVHPDDIHKRELENQRAFENGILDYELRIIPLKNTLGWIRAKGKVMYDEQDKPLRISGGIIDITHEKISRQLIEDSENQLRQLADSMPQLVWMSDADGTISYYNHRLSEYWTTQTGERWQWQPLLHPEDIAPTLKEWNTALVEKRPYAIEHRLHMADGSLRWHLSRAYPQFDEQGTIVKWFGTATDIQALKESEEKFRSLSNSVPQHVWTADAEGQLHYYNQSVFDYSGLTLEQINKDGWLQIVHPDDREENIQKWTEAIQSGKPFLTEHRFRRYDGEYRWQLSRALPQRDSNGKIQMWVGTSTDIDDIKKHEQQKDDFIKMASHELKTPVTSIKGYVQLLQKLHEQDDNSMLKTYLSTIDKQISKLTNLITDLLDVTKIETGTLQLNKQVFPIIELVISIAEDLQHTCPTHRILIEENSNQLVFADKDRVSQVLTNYITNAIKYSPKADKIIISVRSTAMDVIISVQDFGIGIAHKDHQKIFERFYRVQGKNEQTYPGFGIGLFIVQEIINRHHGQTWVESEKDKGSIFYFSLPLHSI